MRYQNITSDFFKENRKRIFDSLEEDSIAVFCGAVNVPRSADASFAFVQCPSFFYLTGIDQEDCFLVLIKSQKAAEELLFIPESSKKLKVWEGAKLSSSEAMAISGIENLKFSKDFWVYLSAQYPKFKKWAVYEDTETKKVKTYLGIDSLVSTRIKKAVGKERVANPELTLIQNRMIKHAFEQAQIQKAIAISAAAFQKIRNMDLDGLYEFQLEAHLSLEMSLLGSRRHAFEPIVAGGKNACILHYVQNNEKLEKKDCVLIDFGAEYGNYYADITRVIPVSGKMNNRQIEVYLAVKEIFLELKRYIKPGLKLADVRTKSRELAFKALKNLGLMKSMDKKRLLQYYPHGPSHHLGLDVHDVSIKDRYLEPGMIITCEPGLYILEEELGVRLENDFLISETGVLDLCENIPFEI
jgi:Xaa-Pro aminopeptidase